MAVPGGLSFDLSEHKPFSHSGWHIHNRYEQGLQEVLVPQVSLSHDEQFSVFSHDKHQHMVTFNHEDINTHGSFPV